MDNLIIGLRVVLAVAYIGNKIYKQMSGQGGCGCGGGDSSKLKESSGCGGNCSCDGSTPPQGIKRTDK